MKTLSLIRESITKSSLWILVLVSAFIVPPNGLIAQIVKVDKDWPEGDTNAWQGTVDIETASIRNTQSISQLAGGIQISHSWRKNVAMCIANLRLMYVDRAPLENGGFLHFRYIKGVDSLWAIEGFSQFQFDQLLKIKLRWVTGGGLRFSLLNRKHTKLYFRPGYMYEYENEDSTQIINRHHRLSNYITLIIKEADKLRIYATVYYQPRLDDFSDYRISPALALENNLWKKLILTLSGDVRYDTNPVLGVSKFTYTFTQGLGLRF